MKRGATKISTKSIVSQTLPDDIVSDLKDSFNYYDKDNSSTISMLSFRNILHSFGFAKTSKKELEEELKEHGIEPGRQTIKFPELLSVVTSKWCRHGGKEEEARECFKIFDKKDKGFVTANEFHHILGEMLDYPVNESEIQEFMKEVDPHGEGKFTY